MNAEILTMSHSKPIGIGHDIELKGVSKRFGTNTVVDQLTFSIPRGSFLGLIGANGAGKSTTLKMLAGLLEPSAGDAFVLGVSINEMNSNVASRIGYVPESQWIYPWMTIRETVWFCQRLNPRWNEAICDRLLSLFDLDIRKKTRNLSKGMLAKLGLVLAISRDPEILILDEPMSGLDPIAREEFLEGVLQTVTDRECTVILSSHSINDVQKLSDSIALIHNGRLLVHRATDDILSQTRQIKVVMDSADKSPPELESSVRICREGREWSITVSDFSELMTERLNHAPDVIHFEVNEMDLEEIYKEYVRGQLP